MSREKILDKLADSHQERLDKTLEKLELDVVKATNSIPESTIKTRILVELRPKLKTAIEQNFLVWADSTVRDYDQTASEILKFFGPLPIAPNFKDLTDVDKGVISNLKKLSFKGFEDLANEYLDELANAVYQSTLIGRPKEELIQELRHKINGVYVKSNQADVKKLVAFVKDNKDKPNMKSEVDKAVNKLQTVYASSVTGQSLRRYAGQMIHDSLRQFDGSFVAHKAQEANITSFRYDGSNITDTRQWCRDLKGQILTKDEIFNRWNNSTWKGKSSSDPFVARGGYNCRHFWTPYDPSWDKDLT